MGRSKAEQKTPEVFASFESAKPRIREVIPTLEGLNFILLMEVEGKFLLHRRENQPCYGEMRKYKKSHKDYTDPYTGREDTPSDEYRPSDLHDPFPKGTPVAVGMNFDFYPGDEGINRFMFSSQTPWLRGLPSMKFIEPIEREGNMVGVILWETSFDPTVFVNLLNIRRSYFVHPQSQGAYKGDYYPSLRGMIEGLTELETLIMRMNFDMTYKSVTKVVDGNTIYMLDANAVKTGGTLSPGYYGPMQLDVGMFCRQESYDLNGKKDEAGGTLKDRYDYNRKIFHEVFQDRSRRQGLSSVQEAYESILSSSDTVGEQIEKARRVVREAIEASFNTKKTERAA